MGLGAQEQGLTWPSLAQEAAQDSRPSPGGGRGGGGVTTLPRWGSVSRLHHPPAALKEGVGRGAHQAGGGWVPRGVPTAFQDLEPRPWRQASALLPEIQTGDLGQGPHLRGYGPRTPGSQDPLRRGTPQGPHWRWQEGTGRRPRGWWAGWGLRRGPRSHQPGPPWARAASVKLP